MTAPDLTPQGTEWRTTAPDPAESRWWWVTWTERGWDFMVGAQFDAGGHLWYPGNLLWDGKAAWPAGWRCAPVLSGEYERGRRAGLEWAAKLAGNIADDNDANADNIEADGEDADGSRAFARSAHCVMEAIQRALAPRPQTAPSPVETVAEQEARHAIDRRRLRAEVWEAEEAASMLAPEPSPPSPQRVPEDLSFGDPERCGVCGRFYDDHGYQGECPGPPKPSSTLYPYRR